MTASPQPFDGRVGIEADREVVDTVEVIVLGPDQLIRTTRKGRWRRCSAHQGIPKHPDGRQEVGGIAKAEAVEGGDQESENHHDRDDLGDLKLARYGIDVQRHEVDREGEGQPVWKHLRNGHQARSRMTVKPERDSSRGVRWTSEEVPGVYCASGFASQFAV